MLDDQIFKTVIDATTLVSIDLIAENNGKILLGKRKNKPAQGFYFTTGGRIYKNEHINDAIKRIAKCEIEELFESREVHDYVKDYFKRMKNGR